MFPFDRSNQQMYQRYAQANATGDHGGIDPDEAAGHVQQFMQNAPPEMQQQVYQQHFAQMPYEQRQQFAQQLQKAEPDQTFNVEQIKASAVWN